jgi:arsenate reductase (thioredoxin)
MASSSTKERRALILCTGNSCRSQMAEGIWNLQGDGKWVAFSAGSSPSGFVHPLAIMVMREIGIDISANRSKHLDEFAHESFDLVVTVCGNAKEACPSFPGAKQTEHWPFEDPDGTDATGNDQLTVFRRVRDEITCAIRNYLAGS